MIAFLFLGLFGVYIAGCFICKAAGSTEWDHLRSPKATCGGILAFIGGGSAMALWWNKIDLTSIATIIWVVVAIFVLFIPFAAYGDAKRAREEEQQKMADAAADCRSRW